MPAPKLDLAPPADRAVTMADPKEDAGSADVPNWIVDHPKLSNDAKLVFLVIRSLNSTWWRRPATQERVMRFLGWKQARTERALANLLREGILHGN